MPEGSNWVELTPSLVQDLVSWVSAAVSGLEDIHNKPGSILANERGDARHLDMAQMLHQKNCKQLFILGGDGAHKGALQLSTAMASACFRPAFAALRS